MTNSTITNTVPETVLDGQAEGNRSGRAISFI